MVDRVLVAVASVAILLTGCAVFEDDRLGSGPFMESPEADAIFYLAVRDEALDAEVLWTGVHDEIKAQTSRSDFVDCLYERAGRTGPAAPAEDQERGFEREAGPIVGDIAMNGAEVVSTNVLVREGITYSVSDRRDDRGIVSVDVRVEGPEETYVTTVLLGFGVDDSHWSDPRYAPDGYGLLASFPVVGTVPEDPCLVGAEAVRERLQTTGMISIGAGLEDRLSHLAGFRVLALVWDGPPNELDMVGAAFWWGDEGDGGPDGVHPPNNDGADTVGDLPSDDEEPRRAPDWIDRAFLLTDTVRIEPGTYEIEVWANPSGLTPSVNPRVPVEAAERHCAMEVEVTAGRRTIVSLEDIPTDGGECPHEIESRFGF